MSVVVTEDAGVATIRLDAPPNNRMSLAMMKTLAATFDELATRPELRAVILEASGAHFCAGADLRDPALAERMTEGEAGRRAVALLGERLVNGLAQLPVPTIVAARGHVVGAGGGLFTVADFRLCAADVELSFPEVDRGMHLGWRILPRLVREFGPHRARRLALLGERVPAAELSPAFATLAVDPEDAARALARSIAERAPLAVRAITRAFRRLDANGLAWADGDVDDFVETVASEDFVEAMTAWFERRPPAFRGR